MRSIPFKPFLAALAIVLAPGVSMAAQEDEPARKPAPKVARPAKPKKLKPKRDPNVKQVEMNSATEQELKTLPGISEDLAARIIAGRPYLSKSNLVTHNILPAGIYETIKRRIFVIPKLQKQQ